MDRILFSIFMWEVSIKNYDSDDFHFILSDSSWLHIRFSGTEPLIRISAESYSLEQAKRLLELGKKMIYSSYYDEEQLRSLYTEWRGSKPEFQDIQVNSHWFSAIDSNTGECVGAAQLIIIYAPAWDLHWGLVQDVFVRKEYRQQNIATELMKNIEGYATTIGCRFIRLTTESTREGAIELYKKLGYDIEGLSFLKIFGKEKLPWQELEV